MGSKFGSLPLRAPWPEGTGSQTLSGCQRSSSRGLVKSQKAYVSGNRQLAARLKEVTSGMRCQLPRPSAPFGGAEFRGLLGGRRNSEMARGRVQVQLRDVFACLLALLFLGRGSGLKMICWAGRWTCYMGVSFVLGTFIWVDLKGNFGHSRFLRHTQCYEFEWLDHPFESQ